MGSKSLDDRIWDLEDLVAILSARIYTLESELGKIKQVRVLVRTKTRPGWKEPNGK